MNKKVALFDFDNTLINGDSVGHLLKYYFKKKPYKIIYFLQLGILFIGYLLKIYSFNKVKVKMWQPWYEMNNNQKDAFIQKSIKPYYYKNIFNELDELKQQGYYIIIVSASIEDYLFYLDLNVDGIIGTKVIIKNNKIQSVVHNCIGPNKVPLIESYLKEHQFNIDYKNSIGYSDSKMDYKMLELVSTRHRVTLKTGLKVPYEYTIKDFNKKKIHK